MEKVVRYGIAGCSSISRTHINALSGIENARITAVFDRKIERAETTAKLVGNNPAIYTDYETFLKDDNIDAVLVLTASGVHAEMGMLAASYHKHVVTEKPLDITLEKARQFIKTCDDFHVQLSCIFQHRYDYDVQKLKATVQSGALGRLVGGCSHTKWYRDQAYYEAVDWRGTKALDGGGVVINQGIHQLDLFQYIFGEVEEVFAYCATSMHPTIEVEDICMANIKFKNGALGLYETTTNAYPGYYSRMDIYGTEGSVMLKDNAVVEWNLMNGAKYTTQPTAIAHRLQLQDITDSILAGRPSMVSGRDAYKSLCVVDAIYRSAASGKPEKVNYI